jgi:hypothetical protein
MRLVLSIGPLTVLASCGDDTQISRLSREAAAYCEMQAALTGGELNNTGPLPEGCIKIEDDDLGVTGDAHTVGDGTVVIDEWIAKDGEDGEYVGFRFTASGGVAFSVKAGLDSYPGVADGLWDHPNGTSGPNVRAISNIVFCPGEPPTDEGCLDPVDGDGDGIPDDVEGDDDNDGIPDEQDQTPTGGPDPVGGEGSCTADEDCASGICSSGVCLSV